MRLTRPIRSRRKNGYGRRIKVFVAGGGEMIAREMVYRYSHSCEGAGLTDDDPDRFFGFFRKEERSKIVDEAPPQI